MRQYRKGSLTRQAHRKATKAQHATKRARSPHPRSPWRRTQAATAQTSPLPAPRARSYLVAHFWDHFRLGELLHRAGVKQKFKGLPAVTLMLVALS